MRYGILALVLMTFSICSVASTVDFKITAEVKQGDSIKAASSTVKIALDKKFSVKFQGSDALLLEMLATRNMPKTPSGKNNSDDSLYVKGKVLKHTADGQTKELASPEMIVRIGLPATMTIGEQNQPEYLNIMVLAEKITE